MARMNEGKETWHRLLEWDRGQAAAERLAAILLNNDGLQNIDPSHPLGGKDGKKDIVFFKKNSKWIAGVYFPRGQQSFRDIKDKFRDDLSGVNTNQASGFVFITNQELRLAERQELCDVDANIDIVIYHLERIATMLNTPLNYGVRLEFLDIEMTKEEQLSFFEGIRALPIAQKKSELSLRGILEYKPSPNAHSYAKNWIDSEFMETKEQEINEIYEQVVAIVIPEKCEPELLEVQEPEKPEKDDTQLKYVLGKEITVFKKSKEIKSLSEMFTVKDAEIKPKVQKLIIEYCEKQGLPISNDFFLLGNLKKKVSTMRLLPGNSQTSLVGTDDEQMKYNLIMDLYWKIDEYNEFYDYFSALQKKYYLQCVISNTGTSFDEDIDVKLIFPKGCICHAKDLPIPGYSIIKTFNENSMAETLFMIETFVDIDEFSNYPIDLTYNMQGIDMPILVQGKSASDEYAEYKETYDYAIKRLFCYTTFSDEQHDILSFNIQYLKQNTNMGLPTVLVFNELPQEIEFEIRSKHLPNIVKDSIKIIIHN
jgi:hypothetical protein